MRADQIEIGGEYMCSFESGILRVRVEEKVATGRGWVATDLEDATGRRITVRMANQFQEPYRQPDPNQCSSRYCKNESAMTYLGKPLCQPCWEQACPPEKPEPKEQDMPATKSKKNATKKTPKASAERKPRQRKPDAAEASPKRVSAIDAAATLLKSAGAAMGCKEMITAMADKGLWTSPGGKTPHATLYSAILREIGTKGKDARFKKAERGQFEFNG